MTAGRHHHDRFLRGGRLTLVFLSAVACLVALSVPHADVAQIFSDRPPPVPPARVPDASNGSAISLAPPSGPGSGPPNLPGPLTQPPIANVAPPLPVQPPAGTSTSSQGVLALTARYGKDLPVIGNGLIWRVFADRPDETGTFKLIREARGATPNIVLPTGNFVF